MVCAAGREVRPTHRVDHDGTRSGIDLKNKLALAALIALPLGVGAAGTAYAAASADSPAAPEVRSVQNTESDSGADSAPESEGSQGSSDADEDCNES